MSAVTRRGFLVGLMASTALSARQWQAPTPSELWLADIERAARDLRLRRVKPIRGMDGKDYYVALLPNETSLALGFPGAKVVERRLA